MNEKHSPKVKKNETPPPHHDEMNQEKKKRKKKRINANANKNLPHASVKLYKNAN